MEKLTVGLPVYNAMPFLPHAVDSILNQTLIDFRFIIINDGSTDGSSEYLASINDPRVSVIQQVNLGIGTTLNRLLELCKTEYFARMDADDISLPQRLSTQLEFLEKKREIVLLGTQIAFLAGSETYEAPRTPLNHRSIDKVLMKGKIGLCHSSLLFRTDAAKRIGGYRIRGAGEDFDFFIRMCEVGRIANIGKVLHLYRIHLDSIVATKYYEIRRGIEFAIKCAKCRRNEKPEPSFESFTKEWENRSLIKRILEIVDRWSGIQYRKAILEICNGKKMSGTLRLGIVAVCRPISAFRQIKGQLYIRQHTSSLT